MTDKRFVILDRDGTLIVECNYLSSPEQVRLLPGAAEGLRRMRQIGLGLVVVTNQSGIGRGYFDLETLNRIHQRLSYLLSAEGVVLDGIYFCPHTPEQGCACRKPATGLVEQAAGELGFDPRGSICIGDKPCDIELGRRAGAAACLLVRTGYGEGIASQPGLNPDAVVDDLCGAVDWIKKAFPPP